MISWFNGLLFHCLWIVPIILGLVLLFITNNKKVNILGLVLLIVGVVCLILTPVAWHYMVEVPSVDEKIVTVQEWQPKAGLKSNSNGMMVINSADDLMMITDTGEGFKNDENFLFGKFDTRDILNNAKPGSVVKVKYYGWREGFNNGFPINSQSLKYELLISKSLPKPKSKFIVEVLLSVIKILMGSFKSINLSLFFQFSK